VRGGLLAGGAGAADALPDGDGQSEALSYLFRAADRASW
jgi:hypothetical protein